MIKRIKKLIHEYFLHKAQLFGKAADYLLDPELFPAESYSHARGEFLKAKQELYLSLAEIFAPPAP